MNRVARIAGFGWEGINIWEDEEGKTHVNKSVTYKLKKARAIIIDSEKCQEYFLPKLWKGDLCARVIEHESNVPQGTCNVSYKSLV